MVIMVTIIRIRRRKKGELFMLQFLQTGKVLYILAAIAGLGMFSKLVTSSLYKRLIKETGNMALTKNKNLRALKQKTENMILVSHGVRNPNAYIERQVYSFRFLNMPLDSWDNLSVQAMILCFLIGGIAAFGAYWYRCDSYYIVLYGTMGILAGLFLVFVDNGANVTGKRQHLVDSLIDYVENSPQFYRSVDNSRAADGARVSDKGREANKRENILKSEKTADLQNAEARDIISNRKKALRGDRRRNRLTVLSKKREKQVTELRGESGNMKETAEPQSAAARTDISQSENSRMISYNEAELARSIDYLKQSLEQIAAGREQSKYEVCEPEETEKKVPEKTGKELKPEDLKFLGELLQEYLS